MAALVHAIADTLAARFASCTVRGEVTGWSKAASGHCYFSLRDADSGDVLMRCAMFRRAAGMLPFTPRDGQLVTVRGRVAVYEPRGELQFVVEAMQADGAGALYEQFLRLKARLESQGLFDPARKRPLPSFPRRVGVVTSLGAAALRDVAATLARRAPHVGVVVYPSLVQGADAPAALVAALGLAAVRAEVDVVVLCRGGGSMEDLWAFNDERLVRAVADFPLPIVCGVGHETDVTLCDFAADLRAPTPTAAAELVAPAALDCTERLDRLGDRLRRRVHQALDGHAQRLDRAALRLARPSELIHREQRRLDRLQGRLASAPQRRLEQQANTLQRLEAAHRQAVQRALTARAQRLDRLASSVAALDPHRVLARGFAWLSEPGGRAVTQAASLTVGDELHAVLADGRATMRVAAVDAQRAVVPAVAPAASPPKR